MLTEVDLVRHTLRRILHVRRLFPLGVRHVGGYDGMMAVAQFQPNLAQSTAGTAGGYWLLQRLASPIFVD